MIVPATRGEAVSTLTAAFTAAGLDSPTADARLLVAHVLRLDAVDLLTRREHPISPAQWKDLESVQRRRLAREPVSRIIGQRWFHGRPFQLSSATLDPRPESETLVEVVLEAVRAKGLETVPLRLLDVGTGTGCLLISLLAELPNATGVGVDISAEALETAATNATALGISPTRVSWICGSGPAAAVGIFNVIVSNPPYIATSDIPFLEPDVRGFDPLAALDGGADGLDFYAAWCPENANKICNINGLIVFEVGAGQAPDVARLLALSQHDAPGSISIHPDLAGIGRCVAWRTRPCAV